MSKSGSSGCQLSPATILFSSDKIISWTCLIFSVTTASFNPTTTCCIIGDRTSTIKVSIPICFPSWTKIHKLIHSDVKCWHIENDVRPETHWPKRASVIILSRTIHCYTNCQTNVFFINTFACNTPSRSAANCSQCIASSASECTTQSSSGSATGNAKLREQLQSVRRVQCQVQASVSFASAARDRVQLHGVRARDEWRAPPRYIPCLHLRMYH